LLICGKIAAGLNHNSKRFEDAATPQSIRQAWLSMSMDQRKQAAEKASAWLHAHQGNVPIQHATLHDDG
jgi:hypothetical protein